MASDLLCLLRNYGAETFMDVYNSSPSKAGLVFEWYVCWKNDLIHWNRIKPDEFEKIADGKIKMPGFKKYKLCKKCGEHCVCCNVCAADEYCRCVKFTSDFGIDAVNKNLNELWQMKFYLKSRIPKGMLFEFYGLCNAFGYNKAQRKWCTNNGAKIVETPINQIMINDVSCVDYSVDEIEQDIVQLWAENANELKRAEISNEEFIVREYQQGAIDIAVKRYMEYLDDDDNLDELDKTILNVFCGLGKTFIGCQLLDKLQTENCKMIISCNSLLLQYQWHSEIAKHCKYVKSCVINGDVEHIIESDVYITTSVVSTIKRVVEHINELDNYINYFIIDEGHHVLDQNSEKLRQFLTQIECHKLYLSGTTESESHYEVDMEYGIVNDYLTDYNIVIPIFEESVSVHENLANMLSKETHLNYILGYCNTIEEAKKFTECLNRWNISATYYTGETDVADRLLVNKEFCANVYRVLVTVNTLSEGIDLPRAQVCMFVEPRHSRFNVMQCVGRVLRKHVNKQLAYVILPAYNESESKMEEFFKILNEKDSRIASEVKRGNFARFRTLDVKTDVCEYTIDIYNRFGDLTISSWWKKYAELQKFVEEHKRIPTHNENRWVSKQMDKHKNHILSQDKIDALNLIDGWVWDRHGVAWWKQYIILQKFVEAYKRLPSQCENTWINGQRRKYKKNKLSQQQINALESIDGWMWDSLDEIWWKKYTILQKFVEEHKRLPTINEQCWIGDQRQKYRRNELSQEQIDALNQINGWVWNKRDDAWWKNYVLLQKFVEKHKRIPTFNENFWINSQRQNYKNNKLTQEQIDALEQINMWMWDTRDETWWKKYTELQKFIKEHNRLPTHNENGWVISQRQKYKKNKLLQQQINALESIDGWMWDSLDEIWWKKYTKLQKFVEEHNRLPTTNEDSWACTQRQNYKNGKLSQKQVDALEQINMWMWNTRDESWWKKYTELQKFIKEHNQLPTDDKNGWIQWQRQNYKNGKLSQKQVDALEQIDGWMWDARDETWWKKYAELQKFIEEHNRLPTYDENHWISKQRQKYKNSKLSQQQIDALERINIWVWKVL